VGKIYDRYFADAQTQQIEQWFNLGGTVKLDDNQPTAAALADLKQIQGLFEKLSAVGVKISDSPAKVVAAAEFLLEGLVAHRKLSRSEERGFAAQEKMQRKPERPEPDLDYEDWQQIRRTRKGGLN
jgi:magnesium chelatase subunit I